MKLLFKKNPGWLAVNITPERIDIVHVRRNDLGKPEIVFCDSYRQEGQQIEALIRLRKTLHLERYHCTTLLNFGDYKMLQIDPLNLPSAELKSAVRWRVKDMIDYPVNNATLDILNIPGETKNALFAVVAPNETVARRMQLFQEAGIPLEVIDVAEMAQRNVSALFETQGRGLAMLSFGELGGLLTFTYKGELYLSRFIDLVISQLTEASEEQRKQQLERIALELQRSLDHFDRQYRHIALSGLLLTPMPSQIGLEAHLTENLGIPVETLDLGRAINCSLLPELRQSLRQAQCFQTIGAALRTEVQA